MSLRRVDEVDAIAAAGIEAALKPSAVIQRLENPIAEEHKRQNRDQSGHIRETRTPRLFIRFPAREPAHETKLNFVWSIARHRSSARNGIKLLQH
jgi:hypothetical protein